MSLYDETRKYRIREALCGGLILFAIVGGAVKTYYGGWGGGFQLLGGILCALAAWSSFSKTHLKWVEYYNAQGDYDEEDDPDDPTDPDQPA